MEELFKKISEMLSTDIQTLYKSFILGTTSTGAVEVAKVANSGWELQSKSIDLCWAIVTCIILTLVSLFVTECYKSIKKKVIERRKK